MLLAVKANKPFSLSAASWRKHLLAFRPIGVEKNGYQHGKISTVTFVFLLIFPTSQTRISLKLFLFKWEAQLGIVVIL